MNAKMYAVYDEDDELVIKGTAKECSAKLGVDARRFREAAERTARTGKRYKGCRIVELAGEKVQKAARKKQINGKSEKTIQGRASVIAAWDALVEPLRKKYGIPVYKEGRGNDDDNGTAVQDR